MVKVLVIITRTILKIILQSCVG